jgi:hypothetical protein
MSEPQTFTYEIRNAQGHICCAGNDPDFPRCPKCEGKAVTQGRQLRTAVYDRFNPPDGYAIALERLRKEH